ncbi:MAG: GPP34 family phosphoprotein [Candidatus Zixiibacteriota bacterium]|nr:MAG: GPP34 family phosphoprotein [candidate division Zixibacteria bacterium]
MRDTLCLHEELLLLALRDDKGTVKSSVTIEYPLAGAILAELLLQKRLTIDPTRPKKQLVALADKTLFGDPLLDETILKIRDTRRPASLKSWVMRIARLKKLRHRTAERLCRRGILRSDKQKVLLFFTRRVYPQVNPEPQRQLVNRLRGAVFGAGEVDPRTSVLVALAYNSGVLKNVFAKQELKAHKQRIKQIATGDAVGRATREAIMAVQTAVMMAAVIPAITGTAAGRH